MIAILLGSYQPSIPETHIGVFPAFCAAELSASCAEASASTHCIVIGGLACTQHHSSAREEEERVQ